MSPPLNPNDPRVNGIAQAIELAKAAQAKANEIQAEREAEKVRDALAEANSKTFDKSQSYTTVIVAGGYAGLFAVWSSAKDALSSRGSIAIALCLTISLAFFVLYEVAAIAIRTFGFLRLKRTLAGAKTMADYAALIEAERKREAKAGQRFIPAYAVSLVLTLLPAMVAAGLIVYNTTAKLLGWPNWPR